MDDLLLKKLNIIVSYLERSHLVVLGDDFFHICKVTNKLTGDCKLVSLIDGHEEEVREYLKMYNVSMKKSIHKPIRYTFSK